jgi:hypothetical protein
LIFVALAVAWAVYLIPKALEHHEEGARTRTVERFSARLRILGRREPVSRRKARLVTSSASTERTASRRTPEPEPVAQPASQRQASARAARRRRRVVSLILLANIAVAAVAYVGVIGWVWCAVPAGILVAWLVACRLMVKRERARLRPRVRIPAEPTTDRPKDGTEEVARIDAPLLDEQAERDPDRWDPVSVPLPTYVSKPVAPRSVSTIDLDSTGVWSSGRSAADSLLAREAEAVERSKGSSERRASGA